MSFCYYCNIVAFMNTDLRYQAIKAKGGRLTKTRMAIIDILVWSHCLMSLAELRIELDRRSLSPDRSTLFRELQYLSKNAIVIKNTISGINFYEIPHDHHHHLVCLECNSIDKITIDDRLEGQEKQIAKQNKFTVTSHSLEFYGYCKKCR